MLDVDDYVNNTQDSEAAEDSYETYISAEMNYPDVNINAVYEPVKKRFWNDDSQSLGVINRNPLLDTSKYEVDCLDGYI